MRQEMTLILSSTLHEIGPHTNYVVCLSVSPGFPYMISVFPCFFYRVSLFPCFLCMVMLPKYLNVNAIVLDWALLWVAMGRYCDVPIIRPLLSHGIRADLSGSLGPAIMDSQSIDYLLDFIATCSIFTWNNFISRIGRNCRLGRVLWVLIFGPSALGYLIELLALLASPFVQGQTIIWEIVSFVISKRHWCYFSLCVFVLDKRYTLWLRDMVSRHHSGSQRLGRWPLTSLRMSAWPYHVTTKYSYFT